jgi:pimeloyl-ACP methyl ester carboxylesterase
MALANAFRMLPERIFQGQVMQEPTLHHIHCTNPAGGHRMAYWEWGDAANPHVVVCVHGLSRQGRDFDALAKALLPRVRVVSVDVVGRGHSDWLTDPSAYGVAQYAQDMFALLAHLQTQTQAKTIDWVGTSMGGLIGMAVCGQPQNPVRRLVLNDVGPALQAEAIVRIGHYIGQDSRYDTIWQAIDALWLRSPGFGPHTPPQWLDLSLPMIRNEGNRFKLHYDPAIALAFKNATPESAAQGEAVLWQLYDAIKAQTLLIRGADSDLLSPQTAQAMTQRGPKAKLVTYPNVGHAPTLITPEQIAPIEQFLLA